MKVHKINKKFRKFGEFQVRNRWWLLSAAIIFALIGLIGLKHLQPHNSRESWFDDAEAIEINTKKFEEQFGNNDNIIVLVEAKDVFAPEVLKMLKNLGNQLLDSLPYADEVISLADMEISRGTEEGMEVINPFENGIPDDPAEIEKIRKLVLSRRALVNKIVSDDCTETLLMLSLKEFPKEEEWSKETTKDPLFQVGEVAIRVITSPEFQSENYTLKPVGQPYTETEERDFFGVEMAKRILSGFIAMLLLLALLVRSFRGVATPLLTLILAAVSMFGYMGWAGIGYDQSMVMLPAMLGMALAVAYSIHLFNAFKRFYYELGNRKEAVISAVEETGWPLLFTAITTMGSVASFATVGIQTITWVGLACASIVFSNYLFVIIVFPIVLSFGKNRKEGEEAKKHNHFLEKGLLQTGNWVVKRNRGIIVAFVLIFIALVPSLFKIKVDMDLFKSMGLKIPYINRVYEITQSQLGSYMSYNVSIDFDEEDAIKSPENLKKLDVLVDSITQFSMTKKVKNNTSVFSILDIIKEMNQTLRSDSIEYYRIPDTHDEIAQILLLYEMSGGTKTFNWIDEEYSMLRVQVPMYMFKAKDVTENLEATKQITAKLFPNATTTIVGSGAQFAEVALKIVSGELQSVLLSLFIISVLLVFVFGSFKTGLIGLIPNLAPMLAIGAYMGYSNTPLNMMSMTAIPMMLGIAVDDTIHFINSLKFEFERTGKYSLATVNSFKTVGKSLIMTTMVLVMSFIMYLFSPVNMVVDMGILASIGLITALLTDYFITPALIMVTKPFGKEVEGIKNEELKIKNG